jgi:hypothetical protein
MLNEKNFFPKIQFHLSIENGEYKSICHKTNFFTNSDIIDIKETFYYPNIPQGG